MSARPRFVDPDLEKAAEEHESALVSRTIKLDEVSTDIKTLEAWLDASGVRRQVEVTYAHGDGSLLAWAPSSTERWRIFFVDAKRKSVPLIEASGVVRLLSRSLLPVLLRKVSEEAARADWAATPSPTPDVPR